MLGGLHAGRQGCDRMDSELTIVGGRVLGETLDTSHQQDIFVVDGVIDAIADAGERPPVGVVIDARNQVVTPGLINSHHHSHEHYHKGRYDRVPLELWMNYVRPLTDFPITPRQVYVRTLIGAIQALKSGTTTIVDDLNAGPKLDPALIEASLQAYRDIGIRAMVGVTLFDKPFFRAMPFVEEEFPAELLAKLNAVPTTPASQILDFVSSLAVSHHPSSARVAALLAPSAPQRCTDDFLRAVRRTADDLDLPVIIHVQETRLQAVSGELFYGKSMYQHLGDIGFLKPKTQLIHAVRATPNDMQLLATAGASVQHNPNSNMKLGSGLMPMRAFLDAGVNVSLGTDGCGSIETVDMLRTVSSTALVQKLRGGDHTKWIGATDAWHAGTIGGAIALGMEGRLGEISVGASADLCCYRLDTAAMTPLNNPLQQIVYGETGSSLDTIIVDGKVVMESGNLIGIDELGILREAHAAHTELEPFIAKAEASVNEMMPAYRRICDRCDSHVIDQKILPARF